MHITMVKKRLVAGQPCRKCAQAEELLRARGLWQRIDEVVWADDHEPSSAGMRLAERFGVETAPFFVLRDKGGHEHVIESTLALVRALLPECRRDTSLMTDAELHELSPKLASAAPKDIVRFMLERFGCDSAIAFSGAEDVMLVDLAARTGLPFSVFCLDTGRLHPETYRFIDKVRKHYGIELDLLSPDAPALAAFVRKKGLFSFYEDGHAQCCAVRKVEPLRRALAGYRAWMTGQRQDQSPATRGAVAVLQRDPAFAGKDGPLVKCNPLAMQSSAQVWAYLRDHGVPYNELHERGFVSIGCEPCTRAVHPGQHEREGRWWWEAATQKECGLHSVAPKPAAATPSSEAGLTA